MGHCRIDRIAILLVLALAAGCTTTAPPSRLDSYLCGDELIAAERGSGPPAASCVPVSKWPSRGYSDPQLARCGPGIANDGVRVVEIGDPVNAMDSFTNETGRYGLVAPGWMAIDSRSTDAATVAKARRIAASSGCPLLLLGPVLTFEQRTGGYDSGGRVSVLRYRLFRLGGPAGPDDG